MAFEDKVSMCSKCKMVYLYPPDSKPERNTCGRCGAELIHTPITAEELFLIKRVSKDRDFINAMIKLKENDIVEYMTKISQYREQAKNDGCYESKTKSDVPKCPKCGSTSIQIVPRKWSLLGGFATKKTDRVCVNCKYKW